LTSSIEFEVRGLETEPLIDIAIPGDDNIVLDLNGFALIGARVPGCVRENNADGGNLNCLEPNPQHGIVAGAAGATLSGIARGEAVIRNGNVMSFSGHGVFCMARCRLEGLNVEGNTGWGVLATSSVAVDVQATANGFGGVFAHAIRDSRANDNGGSGLRGTTVESSVVQNTLRRNGTRATGISASLIDRSVVLDTVGLGAIGLSVSQTTIQRATTGLEILAGGSAMGNTVSASQRGIVLAPGSSARNNVVNASAPITGNPVVGANTCGGSNC
jgi:hypothetical protein